MRPNLPALPRLLLVLLAAAITAPARAASDAPTPEEARRGHRARTLLAKPRAATATATTAAVAQAEAAAGVRVQRIHARLGGIRTLETDGTEDVLEVIKRLAATGLYEYVEPVYIRRSHVVPDDARFAADQWSLQNTGQAGGTPGADIKAVAAWDIQREAPDVIVAVLDTGARINHPDLVPNLWTNSAEYDGRPNTDDDNNGYTDDHYGINLAGQNGPLGGGNGNPNDTDGHGTHVAGIIGAVGNNGTGVTGVAWKVKLMPLRFLGDTGGDVAAAITCIDYAIAKKAHIINASYGSPSFSQAEFDALKRARDAGIIVVASAGNDSLEITTFPEYPAAYPLDNIVAVASTTRQDRLASYSTFGSGLVDLAAPGSSILSLGHTTAAPYATMSGTSMAAPHVSGALALLKQKYPNDNYRGLINRLLSSVDVLPALENRVHTNGRLNLLRALETADNRPFNDSFARRATITGGLNLVRGSTQFATTEPGEPAHGTPGTGATLWWSWTAPPDTGTVIISTAGSGIDTVLAVYRVGPAPSLAALELVATSDDVGDSTASTVAFTAIPGATYAIAIGGKNSAEGLVTFSLESVLVNDAFARAKILHGSSVATAGNNNRATAEPGEPNPQTASGRPVGAGKTLWYRWTAPETRSFQISADSLSTDPVTSIYTGTAFDNLVRVSFDDDSGPSLNSLIRFNATAGVTYHICVDSYSASGPFTLTIADAAWQYVAEFELHTPAVGPDGTLYAADAFGYVHAINPDGTRKWRSSAIDGFVEHGSVAIADDGTVYVADDLGDLYALAPATGAMKWVYATGDFIWAAPAVGPDGTIYVKSDDGQLHAVTPAGTLKWKFAAPGDTYTSPVVAADGTIYFPAGGDNALIALNPDGAQKWRANLGATVYASPALGADGTIYLGNYDGRFFALRPDGTERWRFDTGNPLSGSAAIDARGVVYFGSYDKKLYALDAATGAKKWDYATGDIIRSTTPTLADDGTIYIASDDGFIHALDPDGKLKRTYATSGPILSAPLLAAGRLHVTSTDSKLYAFDTANNLARAPWPMHRHNLRRSARPVDPLPGMPAIATQPVAVTAALGTAATFTVNAPGATSYQWRFNSRPIPGATSATYTLPLAQSSDVGAYSVLAIGPGGSVISHAANLTVNGSGSADARLINLAVRTTAGSGDNLLFVGFNVGGAGTTGNKPLLIRAVGPTLAGFGVTDALADPRLDLFNAGGAAPIATNDDWAGDTAITALAPQLGAFAFANAASKDAALLSTRAAGGYTAQISTTATGTGTALAEIYDATPTAAFTATTPRLINVSARTRVGTGGDILIAGFVIGGTGSKTILVRAIGPTLSVFGVPGPLANPKLELFASGISTALSSNDDWGAAPNAPQIATAATTVGAFPLALESRDAVLLLTLPPGSYTAQVSGVNNTTGTAIVEVYEVP